MTKRDRYYCLEVTSETFKNRPAFDYLMTHGHTKETAPIQLPTNPFWDVFTRFGRDEMIAMGINVAGTAGIEALLNTFPMASGDALLALAGPIVEKVGFFPAHLKEAWDEYKGTPKAHRQSFSHYTTKAFREGGKSLLEDVVVHDPLYIGLMYAGLKLYPETPAWMLATTSFVAAVVAVAGLEVGWTELAYRQHKQKLQKMGFEQENYYETRFLIDKGQDQERLLQDVSRKFRLPLEQRGDYHDTYYPSRLKTYSGRTPKLRLRTRALNEEQMETLQVVYTRAAEIPSRQPEQFRYFPARKEKLYLRTRKEQVLEKLRNGDESHEIRFTRRLVRDPATLLVAADEVQNGAERPFYVVEVKVRENVAMLKEAMRYVMQEFPVLQTTRGKADLTNDED